MAEDDAPLNDFLDNLMTPQQIAERIKASTGVTLAPRTIWEKARRIGVAKKIGRDMFIHVDDIPKLLEPEKSSRERVRDEVAMRASAAYLLKAKRKKTAADKKKRLAGHD